MLKPFPAPNGYLLVDLSRDDTRTRWFVHRLVLAIFDGPCPAGQEACHGPGGQQNNSLANLRYGTHAENIADRSRDGHTICGEANSKAKLTATKVVAIRARHASGETKRGLGRSFGVAHKTIADVIAGRTWRHV
jgi:hypothetical protein